MAEGKTIGALLIKIAADTAQLRAGIKSSQRDIKGFEKNLGTLKNAFVGLFSVGVITAFAKQSFEAYQQQLKQEKLLLTALKGRADIQERLIRQANYLQGSTLFEDDQIIEQQKMLASIGMSERQIREVIKAATQLATALGVDLGTAVKNLTGTYAGNLRELGKYIPELKTFSKEQLAAGAAVEWVNQNMKGLAETAADTDPVAKSRQQWQEFGELMGKFVAPAVSGVFRIINEGLKQLTSGDLTFWEKLASFAPGTIGQVQRVANDAKMLGAEVVNQYKDEKAALDNVNSSFQKYLNNLKEKQSLLSTSEKNASLQAMADSASTNVGVFGETDLQKYSMDYLPNSIQAPKIEGIDTFKSGLKDMLASLKDTGNKIKSESINISSAVKSMMDSMIVDLASGIGEMIASGDGLNFNFIPKAIASAAKQFGTVLISLGTAALAAKSISLPGGGVGAIVAGTALVAIAAAAESALSNVSNMKAASSSLSSVNHSAASGAGSDYYSRMYGSGYQTMKIEVFGTLNNGMINLSSERGRKQMDRY